MAAAKDSIARLGTGGADAMAQGTQEALPVLAYFAASWLGDPMRTPSTYLETCREHFHFRQPLEYVTRKSPSTTVRFLLPLPSEYRWVWL